MHGSIVVFGRDSSGLDVLARSDGDGLIGSHADPDGPTGIGRDNDDAVPDKTELLLCVLNDILHDVGMNKDILSLCQHDPMGLQLGFQIAVECSLEEALCRAYGVARVDDNHVVEEFHSLNELGGILEVDMHAWVLEADRHVFEVLLCMENYPIVNFT